VINQLLIVMMDALFLSLWQYVQPPGAVWLCWVTSLAMRAHPTPAGCAAAPVDVVHAVLLPHHAGVPGAAPDAAGAPKSDWTEHTAPDGRKYYYNAKAGKSSWEKPDELLSDKDKAGVT